jgi:ankyrin repeat protein
MTPQEATEQLFNAAKSGMISDARECIEAGADARAQDEWGMTALHLTAENGHTGVARLLLERGHADQSAPNREGDTPLHLAAYHGHFDLVRLLISRSADATPKNRAGRTPLDLARLQEHEAVARLIEPRAKQQSAHAIGVKARCRQSGDRGVA